MRFLLLVFASVVMVRAQIPPVEGTPMEAFTFRYIDVAEGGGAPAVNGRKYRVHYTGWLKDGTKFDSSRDRDDPIEFVQGRRQVIAGWESGFAGMKVGGKRRIFIPFQMAYGEVGSPPVIPPSADLVFDVELLDVMEVAAQPAGIDVLSPLSELERKVLQLAKIIPEDKLDWRPAPDVRSFREVLMHIALGNQLMFDIATKDLAGDELKKRIASNAAKERGTVGRDEIARLLTESFGSARKYLDTARAGTLGRDMHFFGTATTRRGIFVSLDVHVGEHLGQLIAYARMNGIAPTW
jgi:hypothetical protein